MFQHIVIKPSLFQWLLKLTKMKAKKTIKGLLCSYKIGDSLHGYIRLFTLLLCGCNIWKGEAHPEINSADPFHKLA